MDRRTFLRGLTGALGLALMPGSPALSVASPPGAYWVRGPWRTVASTHDGQVIEGMRLNGAVIRHNKVVFRNCVMRYGHSIIAV